MPNKVQVHVHESCVIPYRVTPLGVEFCLISEAKVNRWEFPKLPHEGELSARELLDRVATTAGAAGRLEGDKPLAQFVAARGGEARSTSAYLMQVTQIDESWPGQGGRRRLWCLAEEARMRLRRKPLRRLVDVALKTVTRAGGGQAVEGGPAVNGRSTGSTHGGSIVNGGHPAS